MLLMKIILKIESQFLLKVSDNAGGIPKENINNIFTSNFTTKKDGTGIGLYLTKQIIEKFDATIDVQNINYGTCFTITI